MQVDLTLELWPRQLEALTTEATELLFGGATSGGKSHLIRVALITWCLAIDGLQCVLIRKKYDDILKNHLEGDTGFRALLAPLVEVGAVEVTQKHIRFTKNDSLISFVHCQDERQFTSAQGVEKHVLVVDEATQISERLIKFFRIWCRMSLGMKEKLPEALRDKFPRILYTANPTGESVGFFRRNFISARRPWEIDEVDGFKRQFIPSLAEDNPDTDLKALEGRLRGMGELGRVLREGDWLGAIGDFFREYNDEIHAVPSFTPPSHWFKYRTFDWGSSEPFAVYWWAVSDGERFTDDHGKSRWFPRGAIIAYREWYGCNPEEPAKGIGMRNEDIAKGIIERTKEATSNLTFSDNFPFADRGHSKNKLKYTMADTFMENGCPLTLGNTARVYGWKQLRSRLQGFEGVPYIYFVESCRYARDYIPALPYHDSESKGEDAAEHGEATHACDAIRLACTVKPIVYDQPEEKPEPRWEANNSPQALLKRLRTNRIEIGRR